MINIFTFRNLVEAMDLNVLRTFAVELLRPQPAAFADLVNGELQVHRLNLTQKNLTQKTQSGANVDVVLQCQHNWKTNAARKKDGLA